MKPENIWCEIVKLSKWSRCRIQAPPRPIKSKSLSASVHSTKGVRTVYIFSKCCLAGLRPQKIRFAMSNESLENWCQNSEQGLYGMALLTLYVYDLHQIAPFQASSRGRSPDLVTERVNSPILSRCLHLSKFLSCTIPL